MRELVAAGEPLNPEVIEKVRDAWGITVRDGYGQTETTAQVGNPPGQRVKLGSMGRPLPGYSIVLVDPATGEVGDDGEVCVELSPRPVGVMVGYAGDPELTTEATSGGVYHTGDVASRDEDGYLTYVGRADDVFKASDYRISPFELESVLVEHPAVAEAAVVPVARPGARGGAQGLRHAGRGARAVAGDRVRHPAARPPPPGALQAGAAARVRRRRPRPAEDDLRQDPPGRAAHGRGRPGRRRRGRQRRGAFSETDFPELAEG